MKVAVKVLVFLASRPIFGLKHRFGARIRRTISDSAAPCWCGRMAHLGTDGHEQFLQ
jgi:hypothetical protein